MIKLKGNWTKEKPYIIETFEDLLYMIVEVEVGDIDQSDYRAPTKDLFIELREDKRKVSIIKRLFVIHDLLKKDKKSDTDKEIDELRKEIENL